MSRGEKQRWRNSEIERERERTEGSSLNQFTKRGIPIYSNRVIYLWRGEETA